MLARFFKDSAIYAVTSAITGSLAIILLPYLTRKLSPQEYGVMDLLLSSFNIVNVVVPLSISQALARFYPGASEQEQHVYASTGLWFTCFSFLLFLFISLIAIQPINNLLVGDEIYTLVTMSALISMFTFGIFTYLQVQLRWMLKPVQFMLTSLFFIIISYLLTVLLMQYFNAGVSGFFWARIIASIMAGILCWYYSKKSYKFILDTQTLKVMLSFSWPLVISSIGIFVSIYIDRFIIRGMLSLNDVGIYSASARVASIAASIMTVINFALTPLIYSTYQDPKTSGHIAFLFKMIIYVLLAVTIFLMFFSKKILILMLGERYSEGYLVLPLLVASFIVAGLYNFAPGLWIAKKTKLIAAINIGSAFLNTFLCLVFIPYFGYVGAAIATLVSTIITLAASTRFAQKYYYISYDWLKINSAIILTLFCSYLIVHN